MCVQWLVWFYKKVDESYYIKRVLKGGSMKGHFYLR